MRIFRFMSEEEFNKYKNGEVLINETNHSEKGGRTTSKGFCFLDYNKYIPEESFHFLTGLVNDSYCCIFDTNKPLNEGTGIYADNSDLKQEEISMKDVFEMFERFITGNYEGIPRQEVKEYSTCEYSNKDFKLVGYAKPDLWKDKWEWMRSE